MNDLARKMLASAANAKPATIRNWMGLPEDASDRVVIQTAIIRWAALGYTDEEIRAAALSVFGVQEPV